MYRSILRTAVPAVFSLLTCAPAFTQAGEPLVIVVTPSGIEQPEKEANTTLTVIDQKTIEESNASSIAELLRGRGGVHITDIFGDGRQATIDLRGFGPTAGSSTLIMVDGRKLNNSADGAAPDLSLIDIDSIERIEILQGSAGVLYGNQAVGGVVNIIRKKSFKDSANIGIRAGSYNSRRLSASGVKVFGDNSISAAVTDWKSDNYRDHNESENQRLSLRAERNVNGFIGFIEADGVNEDINTPGALLEDEVEEDRRQSLSIYENDYFKTETRMLRAGLSKELDASRKVSFDLTQRDSDREFIQTSRAFPPGTVSTQDRDNNLFNASYQVAPVDLGVLSSYLLGYARDVTDYELVSTFGPQTIDQQIQDVYLSTQWSAGARNQIDAGVRYSDQQAEIDGKKNIDDTVTVFSLGYSHNLDNVKLYARADQNFRYPTVEEHTNVLDPTDPGLETQTGVSVELGLAYRANQNRFRGTLYRIDLDNEIGLASATFPTFSFNYNVNLDETRRHGLILEAGREWSRSIDTSLSFTAMDAEISDGEFEGNQLPLVPKRTIRLDGSYRFNPETLFGLEIVAVGEQVLGGDFANQLEKLDAYNVVNAQASYDRGNWVLGFRINNLFNEQYSEIGYLFPSTPVDEASFFPSPERNFWASLKANF